MTKNKSKKIPATAIKMSVEPDICISPFTVCVTVYKYLQRKRPPLTFSLRLFLDDRVAPELVSERGDDFP